MVNKRLNFLAKNVTYGIVSKSNPFQNIQHNIIYIDGNKLRYGDTAEIFGAIPDNEIITFMKCALSEKYYSKQYYGFIFGFLPASYDDNEIKDNEVKIHYAGVDNTIKKKEFYELCLLLCDAKLNGLDLQEDKEVSRESLLQIKFQLEDKIKTL